MTNTAVTRNLEVRVESFYLPEHSDTEKNHYHFGYRIRLRNLGKETVQLLNRHWVINDSNGRTFHIHGEGVVGKQPELKPGAEFEYESGSMLHSPVGTMEGEYEMVNQQGESFKVKIPLFTLAVPHAVN